MLDQIDSNVLARIRSSLPEIESDFDVAILYACESGSRAWGFASTDSDYDVRFVYIHKPEYYTSIDLDRRRDVIELPIDDELDISGWDIRKALKLFRKSNPPLLEWLSSPIVYKDEFNFAESLRGSVASYFSKKASTYHYLSMAKRNTAANLDKSEILHKKYFYTLRPLLGVRWLESFDSPVPMRFQTMVDELSIPRNVRTAIHELLSKKAKSSEKSMGPPIGELSEFIGNEIARISELAAEMPGPLSTADELDALFRETLRSVWGYT